MPHKQDLNKSLKSTSGPLDGDSAKPCTKHTNEVIKFYCHDHNVLLCNVCVTLEHPTTSCHVDYIPDISGQILGSTEFKETLKDIGKLTEECGQITKDLTQRVDKSTISLKDAIVEIANFRTEINKRLDELEMEVKNTAITIQHDNNKKLKTTETTCDEINKSLQESADTLNTDKKTDHLFIDLKIAQQLILDYAKITTQLQTSDDIYEYIFKPNQAMTKLLQNEKSIGTLRKKELKQLAQPKNKAAVPMKMSTTRNIDAQTSSDKEYCWITGITVAPKNQLFVADYNNSSIKMIDINSGAIKQLLLKSQPWDITIVTRDTLAVTLLNNNTIQFISFSSNSLSLKNKLKVDGDCCGISHHLGKLAVAFTYPAKLQIMDLKGNLKIEVEKDSNGDSIFSNPIYVTTNSHSIYISDVGKKEVIWFNWQGELIGRNVDIKRPFDISLLDDGSFFVSDDWCKCIYRVSGDCKDRTTILENVEDPQAVCWCPETSTLFVSSRTILSRERDNHIKLYKVV
jgi:hypothetical protein